MNQLTRLGAPAPFELWFADLAADPALPELEALSTSEHERAARFVFPRHRRRFLSAHLALRRVLSARTGVAPQTLAFVNGPFGKPALAGASTCAFNLSHSDDVAWIALAHGGDIGVDVEVLRTVDDAAALAQRNFTPSECAELAGARPEEQDLCFLRGWTRKEACLKAIGSGLSIAPETFEAGLCADTRTVRIPTPDGVATVELCSIDGAPGVVGALAQVVARSRAERRAAPKPARIPTGDRPMYPSGEGLR